MRFRFRTLLTTTAIGLALTAFSPATFAAEPATVNIGLLLALSGPVASYGIPERDTIELLAKDINKSGGINNKPIKLFVYDGKASAPEAARGVRQLIDQDHVVAIIGATTGSGTLAMAPVAMRSKVPVLSPAATISVTSKSNSFYPWVFRALPSGEALTEAMFNHAVKDTHAKTIGVFYQQDAYGENGYQFIQKLAKEANIKITSHASAPLTSTNTTPQATKIRDGHPDAVLLVVSSETLGASFVRSARQVGYTKQFWGALGLAQQSFIDSAGSAANGMNLVTLVNWNSPSPKEKKLMDTLIADGEKPTGFGELIGANAIYTITQAIKTIKGPVTGSAVRDALENLCPIQTVMTGKACFSKDDHDGWHADSVVPITINNGKFVALQ